MLSSEFDTSKPTLDKSRHAFCSGRILHTTQIYNQIFSFFHLQKSIKRHSPKAQVPEEFIKLYFPSRIIISYTYFTKENKKIIHFMIYDLFLSKPLSHFYFCEYTTKNLKLPLIRFFLNVYYVIVSTN